MLREALSLVEFGYQVTVIAPCGKKERGMNSIEEFTSTATHARGKARAAWATFGSTASRSSGRFG